METDHVTYQSGIKGALMDSFVVFVCKVRVTAMLTLLSRPAPPPTAELTFYQGDGYKHSYGNTAAAFKWA